MVGRVKGEGKSRDRDGGVEGGGGMVGRVEGEGKWRDRDGGVEAGGGDGWESRERREVER